MKKTLPDFNFALAEPSGSANEFQIIEAAAAPVNLKNITGGVAYAGGKIRQPWSEIPLVLDISGMEVSPQVPLLYSHINDPHYRLGALQVAKGNQLTVTGGAIHQETDLSREIVAQGKTIPWQLSIGGSTIATREVESGQSEFVNGRRQDGPFLLVTRSTLREISVVAVGADADTTLKIAASLTMHLPPNPSNHQPEGTIMDKKLKAYLIARFKLGADSTEEAILAHLKTLNLTLEAVQADFAFAAGYFPGVQESAGSAASGTPAATPVAPVQAAAPVMTPVPVSPIAQTVQAAFNPQDPQFQSAIHDAVRAEALKAAEMENKRIKAIEAACGDDYAEIRALAVNGGWTVEATNQAIAAVKEVRAKRPEFQGNIIVHAGAEINRNLLECALCFREGIAETSIKAQFNEQTMTAAEKMRDLSLRELVTYCAQMEHKPVSASFDNDTIKAAFSTVSLPGILSNVANKVLRQAYGQQPVIATRLCSEGDLNDFKVSERYRMTDVGELQPLAQDGEFKHGGLKEELATNQLDTYGKILTLTRKMIINDDLGAFMRVPQGMGNKAARLIDRLFFARLIANPNNLFSTTHKNYLSGTTSALSLDALKAGRALFLKQVDADKEPINVLPRFLLVHPDLEGTAIELVKGVVLGFTGGDATTGAQAQKLSTLNVVSTYNLEPIASPYLDSSVEWYLFGDPAQVDTFEIGYLKGRRQPTVESGEVDFNHLGISFRIYYDIGIREQDFRGMVKSAGK